MVDLQEKVFFQILFNLLISLKGKDMEQKIKRALISVSDKTNIVELAKILERFNVEIISSGGTAEYLMDRGISVTSVEKITKNPQAFGGRMKTLSFQIGSSLLFRRDHLQDQKEAKDLGIAPIDLVVCNLYPFEKVVQREGNWDELVENIDIGGPTMIRAAAKNHKFVTVLINPSQYGDFQKSFEQGDGGVSLSLRRNFAREAFQESSYYDGLIAQTFERELQKDFETVSFLTTKGRPLRYGENPHQRSWIIPMVKRNSEKSLASTKQLQGRELSYNNLLDADASWRCLKDLCREVTQEKPYAAVVVKHGNPCGACLGHSPLSTLEKAWQGDPISAFGSIISINSEVCENQAQWLSQFFVEVIVAPAFSSKALDIFKGKKNLRLIELPLNKESEVNSKELMTRTIDGGWLVQEEDQQFSGEFKNVTKQDVRQYLSKEFMCFGQVVGKHLKSNGIALVSYSEDSFQLIGAGMGNPNRLISLEQACQKALNNGHKDLSQVLLVSDAFFPFKDGPEMAHEYGIQFILQPGGSIKDQDVIDYCNEVQIKMVLTGRRHFRH